MTKPNRIVEAPFSTLNARQERFVREYARIGNAKRAAVLAGYSPRSAKQIGSMLLQQPQVRRALEALRRAEIPADGSLTAETALQMLVQETADPNPRVRLAAKKAVVQAVGALAHRSPQQQSGECPKCAKSEFLKGLSAEDCLLYVAGTDRERLARMNQEQFQAWAERVRAEAESWIELGRKARDEIQKGGPRPVSPGGSPGPERTGPSL